MFFDTDLSDSEHSVAVLLNAQNSSFEYHMVQCQNIPLIAPLTMSHQILLSTPTEPSPQNSPVDLELICEYWSEDECMGENLISSSVKLKQVGSFDQPSILNNTFSNVAPEKASVECGVTITRNQE